MEGKHESWADLKVSLPVIGGDTDNLPHRKSNRLRFVTRWDIKFNLIFGNGTGNLNTVLIPGFSDYSISFYCGAKIEKMQLWVVKCTSYLSKVVFIINCHIMLHKIGSFGICTFNAGFERYIRSWSFWSEV